MHYTAKPVEPIELHVGDKIRFREEKRWWRVQAVSENFVACVRQADFEPKGTLCYTVIDWRNGIRGACNLIGQGFGDGTYSEEECAEMLTGFEYTYETDPNYIEAKRAYEAGETDTTSWPSALDLEISHRNWVRLHITEIKKEN